MELTMTTWFRPISGDVFRSEICNVSPLIIASIVRDMCVVLNWGNMSSQMVFTRKSRDMDLSEKTKIYLCKCQQQMGSFIIASDCEWFLFCFSCFPAKMDGTILSKTYTHNAHSYSYSFQHNLCRWRSMHLRFLHSTQIIHILFSYLVQREPRLLDFIFVCCIVATRSFHFKRIFEWRKGYLFEKYAFRVQCEEHSGGK